MKEKMKYNTETIEIIDALFEEMNALLPLDVKNQKRLEKKYRLEFNYNSNHLEGNTLSHGQTELLLFHDKVSGDAKLSDIEEMKAHDIALSQIRGMAKEAERPLTENFIKELNRVILVRPFWKEAITPEGIPTKKKIEIGKYKTLPNSVRLRNSELHEYASPEETSAKMNDLMDWYNKEIDSIHPVQLAILFHYKFVCIHPFDDGNGRVARLLMNYILLKNDFPPIIIVSKDKEGYLTALQKADTGDIISMLEYNETQLIWSLNLKIKAAKGEEIEEADDFEKEIELLKREKLSKSTIFKTPKISFDLISYTNEYIWSSLSSSLKKFDDFFAETKNNVYFNRTKIEKSKTIVHPLHKFTDRKEIIKPYQIFGYDLEECEISTILWQKELLSLKSNEKKFDYFINCELTLNEDGYQLIINETSTRSSLKKNGNNLYTIDKEYSSFLLQEDIDKIIKITRNHLFNHIKNT